MSAASVPVVLPPLEITAATLAEFDRLAGPALETTGPGIVVDISEVRLISSAGLGRLVTIGRTLGERGGRLALAGGRRTIVRLLHTVGLSAVMPLFKTVDDARHYIATLERPDA